ncbi:MAG: hypothetical protein C4527_05190 [Candidatus Omnitrophota bacterium]|jgi:hypothetical protein|nr:MAG: hypothetical protein C4527_05190 [Candidatus Omnitrophota bacterium]
MSWLQTLIVALSSFAFTKFIDMLISIIEEKRKFGKYKREMIYSEIEDLKNQVGVIYEISANW